MAAQYLIFSYSAENEVREQLSSCFKVWTKQKQAAPRSCYQHCIATTLVTQRHVHIVQQAQQSLFGQLSYDVNQILTDWQHWEIGQLLVLTCT